MNTFIDAIKNMSTFSKILWIGLLIWAIWEVVQYYRRKKSATALDNEAFNQNLRKVQLIDVRERDDFNAGHILGARNMPLFELKQRYTELRKDSPIYLYEDGTYASYRAAITLKKHGYTDLYVLKDGFKNWDGRIKRNKVLED